MATRESFSDRLDRLVKEARETGSAENEQHALRIGEVPGWATHPDWKSSSEIFVRDLRTGELVAYSQMAADFEQSLREFVGDFIA